MWILNRAKSFFLLLSFIFLGVFLVRWFTPSVYSGVSFSREVYDKHKTLLRLTLSGDEKYRIFTPLSQISDKSIQATLLLEDRYFYYHPGINPIALVRALLSLRSGEGRSGASTLTMQLVRVRYGLRTRTLSGKLWQIIKAVQIEIRHSKSEILEAYLNLVPFGGPIEGIGAASRIYFQRTPQELTLNEALTLAVIPQSPTQRSLAQLQQNESLLKARQRLFQQWIEKHPQDHDYEPLVTLPVLSQKIKSLPFLAPHFTDVVLRDSSQKSVQTTLDLKIQKQFEAKIKTFIERHHKDGITNAAALLIEHDTAEVIAYVGSKDFFNTEIQGQVNGIEARRSPGSALKPFVYALAFQKGLIHSHSLLKDTPLEFALYDPENFDQKFLGPLTAQEALITSRNIPALWLNNQLTQPNFYEFLKSAHVALPRGPDYYGLSLVLGGTEVSMKEMGELYTMLAHKGEHRLLKTFTDDDNSVNSHTSLLTPESAFVVLEMLTKTPPLHTGYQKKWTTSDAPIAWKTGTSHGFKDAWTAGVFGPYVLITWVGNFDNTPNHKLVGREVAAPLFFELMQSFDASTFKNPSWNQVQTLEIRKIKVCKHSGFLPNEYCPHLQEAFYQPGVSPIKKCNIHRPVLINQITGLRSCGELSAKNKIEVYEFWPSDLSHLFAKAGIHRKPPPEYEAHCESQTSLLQGQAPQITSPGHHVSYLQSLSLGPDKNTLTLQAVADGDAKELYWFIDKDFIGKSKTNESLNYIPQVGRHIISVIDDKGRSDHRTIQVEAVQ